MVDSPGGELVGRAYELGLLDAVLSGVRTRGQTLLLRGEPGIGKSSLLAAAGMMARRRGFQILSTTGVPSEAHLPFAGLHQLLQPLLGRLEELPGPQRAAMLAAFGMSEASAPEFFFIALAVLDLLADAAASTPLLLMIEDVQWLDQPTIDVLKFVARRVDSEPTVVFATLRMSAQPRSSLSESAFPELVVRALDQTSAENLLDERAPGLEAGLRQRVLDNAAGNPLALVELPAALAAGDDERPAPAVPLPLTARLERAFASRIFELPASTRAVLLAAAMDDGDGVLSELMSVAALGDVPGDILQPAVAVGLVERDHQRVRFRHPLVRSAVYHAAEPAERRAMHARWARQVGGDPDRQIWHLASATEQADEAVAAALDTAAARARRRGAIAMAIAALERAAALTCEPARRGDRLLSAAELGFELGRHDVVVRLLAQTEQLELSPAGRSRVAHLQGIFDDGTPGDSAGVQRLVDLAQSAAAAGDTDLILQLLLAAARRCWWGDPGEATRAAVVSAGERIEIDPTDPRLLAILAIPDPIGHGQVVIERLSTVEGRNEAATPLLLRGLSAYVVGDFARSERFVVASITQLRAEGRLAHLAQALALRALTGVYCGNWEQSRPAAEEACRLAEETRQPVWTAAARIAEAMLAGVRSERDVSEQLDAVAADQAGRPAPSGSILAAVQTARGLASLATGRPGPAFEQLQRMLDPADPAFHHMQRFTVIGYLAEAALDSGQLHRGRAEVAALEAVASSAPSPMLHLGMAYARAVLAEPNEAEALFRVALRDARLPEWPFPRARLNLAFGTWLRSRRRIAESREPLRVARDLFDALGGAHWGERARQELRAAGESSQARAPEARDRLSPQELQIAQMAAEGLSNREIGQRLYLSHRTVGTHLYRIFPKLEITSRTQLRAVLREIRASAGP